GADHLLRPSPAGRGLGGGRGRPHEHPRAHRRGRARVLLLRGVRAARYRRRARAQADRDHRTFGGAPMRPLRSGPARPLATLVALLVAAAAGFAAPEAASAQSLFNSAGLGSPVDPVDGRVRALPRFGLGLQGRGILPLTDPASAARVPLPSAVMVGRPTWAEVSRDAVDAGELRGTRFPLLGIAYPAFGGMVTVHLGSLLDQRFSGERPSTI